MIITPHTPRSRWARMHPPSGEYFSGCFFVNEKPKRHFDSVKKYVEMCIIFWECYIITITTTTPHF